MSPRTTDPAVRAALIDAAAHLLSSEGPAALSTRRLATEVGVSTMRIYTHFGSMSDLHAAVRREGFSRLATAFGATEGDDPVARLAAGCAAYLRTTLDDPELYWAIFNHRPPAEDDDAGTELFEMLQARVDDCIRAGRFPDVDADLDADADADAGAGRGAAWAGQIWAALHGISVLDLSGTLPRETVGFLLSDLLLRLAIGYGDDPRAARRSIASIV